MRLATVPISAVVSRDDCITCAPYHAILSAGNCCARQEKARQGIGMDMYRLCRICPDASTIERLSGGPVQLGQHDGRDEVSFRRGAKRATVGRQRTQGAGARRMG